MNYIYDIETFRGCFSCVVKHHETQTRWIFEVSRRRNQSVDLIQFLYWLRSIGARMVGFNNEYFDYGVLHQLIAMESFTAQQAWEVAQSIINSGDRFSSVWPQDRLVTQLDLYKIHHFDNPAKSTSLKALEFNMRATHVVDLPYSPHTDTFTDEELDNIIAYNAHDVEWTEQFFIVSKPMIEFREKLSAEYQQDWLNANDTKIGKSYFIMRLESARPGSCYIREPGQPRRLRQTPRSFMTLRDIILPSVQFRLPEFQRLHAWLLDQTIFDTRGVFDGLSASVNGFDYVFGTGGIHGSVERQKIVANDEYEIVDVDVASFYPNLAIANRLAPEHLGELFCEIYAEVYAMRQQYDKSSPINGMLKLALNGVYGDSNNIYSPFYDPKYTMMITINGQLLLCMLAELFILYTGCEVLQINTDGMTVRVRRDRRHILDECCDVWQSYTRLDLEKASYNRMWIRDVNNYLAEYDNGKIKRKGAYETLPPGERKPLGWHQDTSALVVPRIAERVMVHGEPLGQLLVDWRDPFDFMLRCKVRRSDQLIDDQGNVHQTLTRYHIARQGVRLTKRSAADKSTSIQKGWFVNVCNDASRFDWHNLELRWYEQEINKLLIDDTRGR